MIKNRPYPVTGKCVVDWTAALILIQLFPACIAELITFYVFRMMIWIS